MNDRRIPTAEIRANAIGWTVITSIGRTWRPTLHLACLVAERAAGLPPLIRIQEPPAPATGRTQEQNAELFEWVAKNGPDHDAPLYGINSSYGVWRTDLYRLAYMDDKGYIRTSTFVTVDARKFVDAHINLGEVVR